MTCLLSPVWNGIQHSDAGGDPLAGGKIYAYVSGSLSVAQATFTDATGLVQNPNPIVLDSSGRGPNIWLSKNESYTLVLKSATDVIISVIDNVVGVYASEVADNPIWNIISEVPAYVSTSSLVVPGEYLRELAVGNRIRVHKSSGFVFGLITQATVLNGNTTLSVALDAGGFDNTMDQISYSSMMVDEKPADAGEITYQPTGINYDTNSVGYQLRKIQEAIEQMAAQIAAGGGSMNPNAGTAYKSINGSTVTATSALGAAPISSSTLTITPVTANMTIQGGQAITNQILATKNLITNETATLTLVSGAMDPGLTVATSNFKMSDGTMAIWVTGTPGSAAASYNAVYRLSILSGDTVKTATLTLTVNVTAAPVAAHGQQVFTNTGTFVVPANVTSLQVRVYAAGGGGSNATSHTTGGGIDPKYGTTTPGTTTYAPGYNGGSGGVASSTLTVVPGQTYNVIVGSGGAAGATGTSGQAASFSGAAGTVAASGGQGGGAPGVGANGGMTSGQTAGTPGADTFQSGLQPGLRGVGGTATSSGITGAASGGIQGAVVVTW